MKLFVPTKLAGDLSFYVDTYHHLNPVLAPAGWRCTALEGADGTSVISVYPPGVKAPGATNATENTVGVVTTFSPFCQSCVADTVCPVFLHAETQLGYSGVYCPTYVPSTESVRFGLGNADSNYGWALLHDPPGSQGVIPLSGGDYPATGAVVYLRTSQAMGGNIGCSLPNRYGALCQVVVSQFVQSLERTS